MGKFYKVLVADDEYWTREKLRTMIDWDEYSLQFLEPARDGSEVLERIREERPDILITDINMPFVNGIELLKIISREYKEMVTFVVSGYDDFEYVKSTFMSGAVNYLVKPVTKIDLVNAIARALEIISERETEKMQLLKAASLMQDQEFSQLIQKNELSYVPDISMNSAMDLAGVSLLLLKLHNTHEIMEQNGYDINLFSYSIKKEILRVIGEKEVLVFNNIHRFSEFIIISEMKEEKLIKIAERLRIYFSKYARTCLTFCISGHSYSMERIYSAYVEVIALLMTRRFSKKDAVLFPDKALEGSTHVNFRFRHEHEKQLKHFLESGNGEAAKKMVFQEIGLSNCEEKGWSYLEVRQTVKQMVNVFTEIVIARFGHKGAADVDSFAEAADRAVEYLDEREVCQVLEEMIDYLKPDTSEKLTESMRGIVRQAAGYVDEHYFEEITLSFLADLYHVEHSYFSKVFRQEQGENLIVYLTNKRIEKAKQYIEEQKMNLNEIAFMVGYDDYTYFSRVFKKKTGVSPREYKKQISGEEH